MAVGNFHNLSVTFVVSWEGKKGRGGEELRYSPFFPFPGKSSLQLGQGTERKASFSLDPESFFFLSHPGRKVSLRGNTAVARVFSRRGETWTFFLHLSSSVSESGLTSHNNNTIISTTPTLRCKMPCNNDDDKFSDLLPRISLCIAKGRRSHSPCLSNGANKMPREREMEKKS